MLTVVQCPNVGTLCGVQRTIIVGSSRIAKAKLELFTM